MLVLLPVVPAVVAVTALVQCGKARELQKPGDKGGLSSKKSLPSRPGPRSSKSGPAPRSKPRSAPSKRPISSKKPSSTKSSKRSKEKSALKSKLTKKPDESTKTAKKGTSDKLSKDKKDKEKSDKEQDKKKSERSTKKTSKSSKKDTKNKEDVSKSTKTAKSLSKVPAYKDVIKISVSELHWKPTGGLEKFFIQNKDQVSRAFKIKCSDNLLYRFSPVYGTVEPNGKFEVKVLRNNGASKVDKLVILTVQAPGDKKGEDRWKEVLAAGEPQAELAVVPLIAFTA